MLIRDPGGLLLLLLMPAVLIIVMSTVQDAPYKDYKALRFKMPVVNRDKGPAGNKIIQQLKKSDVFVIIDNKDQKPYNEHELSSDIQSGQYPLGIIIPPNTSAALVNKSNELSNMLAQGMGMPATLPVGHGNDSAIIKMLFDPASKPSLKTSLSFALNQYIAQIQMQLLLERLSRSGGDSIQTQAMLSKPLQSIYIREVAEGHDVIAATNSVQHNVPAWTIFGMFLIVVPIAGNMIRERDEGSAVRLRLIPNASRTVALGKILFYILLCLFQFLIMLLIGIYILPLTGLDSLQLGAHPLGLVPMAIAIAFGATAYGFFVGSVFKTANQAMSIGAISVVLVAAIGGVWVPIEILPKFMQQVALISPLHWSLQGLNGIMLRNQRLWEIWQPLLIMIIFGMVLTYIGVKARND